MSNATTPAAPVIPPLPAALKSLVYDNLAPIMLGMVFSSILFGITLLQTFYYFVNYPKDSPLLKGFVVILSLFDAVQLVTVVHGNWYYLIENFGNPLALNIVSWSFGLEVALTACIASLVHFFFAWRIWRLSESYIISLLIMVLSVTQWAFVIYFVAYGQKTKIITLLLKINWAGSTGLGISVLVDVIIMVTLCYLLRRKHSAFKGTNDILDSLIMYTVNTGVLTTSCAVCTVILEQVFELDYYSTIPYFVLSKFYVNSVLATLNARSGLRAKRALGTDATLGGSSTNDRRSHNTPAINIPLVARSTTLRDIESRVSDENKFAPKNGFPV